MSQLLTSSARLWQRLLSLGLMTSLVTSPLAGMQEAAWAAGPRPAGTTKRPTSSQIRGSDEELSEEEETEEETEGEESSEEEKVVRLNYVAASWEKVLNDLAEATDSQLVIHSLPGNRYNRRDFKKHTRSEAVNILNRELETLGFRILVKDQFLTVISMRAARTEYRRPVYPSENTKAPQNTIDTVHAPQIERRFDNITPRQNPQAAPVVPEAPRPETIVSTRPRVMRSGPDYRPNIQQMSFQEEGTPLPAQPVAPPTPVPQKTPVASPAPAPAGVEADAVSLAIPLKQRTAKDVARQLRSAFPDRSPLTTAGPQGLPAFNVLQLTEAGKLSSKIWFTIELDMDRNQLWVHGPAAVAESVVDLAQSLDVPAKPDQTTRLISGEPKLVEVADRLQPTLTRLAAARRQLALSNQEESPETPPAAPNPPTSPQPGMPAAPEDDVLGIGNLRGDVNIQALDDLDLLILQGNDRDVENVMQVIRAIERMALGATPEIRLHMLQHVDSESLAPLLTDVYERLGNLRNRPTGQTASPQSISVVPVGKPNAVLILAPGSLVESVVDLIDELDRPVDPRSEVQVFPLQHAAAADVVTLLTQFYADRTALETQIAAIADSRTNSVVVQARPAELAEVASLIKRIDKDEGKATSQLKVVPLKNATADELATFLTTAIQSVLNPVQQQGIGGFAAQAGQQQRTPKSVVLEFLRQEGTASRLIKSGLLSDIRINADVRTNSLLVTAPAQSIPLLEELIQVLDQPSSTVAEIKVFSLRNADAAAAVELLEQLFPSDTEEGQLGVALVGAENANSSLIPLRFSTDTRTNSVVAIGGGASLQIVEAILLRLDESDLRNRQNVVIKLRNSFAPDVASAVNTFLQGQRDLLQLDPNRISTSELLEQEVIVTPEPISNSLLISATPRFFENIRQLVAELDREPAQVVMQALLVEVELDNTDEFGVELGLQDSVLFDRSVLSNLQFLNTTTTAPNGVQTTTQNIISQEGTPGFLFNNNQLGNNVSGTPSRVGSQGLSNFAVGRVNNDLGYGGLVLSASSESVSLLIRALASRRNVQVLSRPQILALDNQTAQIQVGQQVPIVDGVNITAQGLANPNIRQDEAGIILTVTPRISPEGMVVMELVAEKSAFNGAGVPIFTDGTNGNVITSPIKDISAARTTVKVPVGQTIVVGGMITKGDETIERKVPWLGDLPIIGLAFRYDSFTTRRTELLIFLTPRLVEGHEQAEFIKQVEAERMHFFLKDAEDLHGPLFGVPPEDTLVMPPEYNMPPVLEEPTPLIPGTTLPPGSPLPPGSNLPSEMPLPPRTPVIPPPPAAGIDGGANVPTTTMPPQARDMRRKKAPSQIQQAGGVSLSDFE